LDPEERPASLSRRIAQGLLRDELGFTGATITDAMEMRAVADRLGPVEAARAALAAGCDLLLYGAYTPDVRAALEGVAERALGKREGRHLEEEWAKRVEPLFRRPRVEPPKTWPEVPVDLVALCRRSLRATGDPNSFLDAPGRGRWLV